MSDESTNSRRSFLKTSTATAVSLGMATITNTAFAAGKPSSSKIGNGPYPTEGMAAHTRAGDHKLISFQRRALGPTDVAIKIQYCGICHSDIHTVKGDWFPAPLPLITGHESTGVVVAVGPSVSRFRVGDRVGVGTLVDSCGHCEECFGGTEQFCDEQVGTYGAKDKDGSITQGGYSKLTVVKEGFVVKVPDTMDLAHAGPLMCAGLTVYSPMRHWNVGPGKKFAVLGFGGLGHIAVMLGKAMGAEVTVFTTSPEKVNDAKKMGASEVIINKEGAEFSKVYKKFHFILDTIPYQHSIDPFWSTLKRDGTFCRVGIGKATTPNELSQFFVNQRRSVVGSTVGREKFQI